MQVRAIDRPGTLPAGALRVDPAVEVSNISSSAAAALHLGAGFGFSRYLEAGFSLPPLQVAPEADLGPANLYGAAGFDPLPWLSIVPLAHLDVPVESEQVWAAGVLVSLQAALTPSLQVWIEPGIVASIDSAAVRRLDVPVVLSAQVTDRVFAEARAGLSMARSEQTVTTIDPTTTQTTRTTQTAQTTAVPVSGLVGFTFGSSDGPLIDLSLGWQWPALFRFQGESTSAQPEEWSIIVVASANLPVFD